MLASINPHHEIGARGSKVGCRPPDVPDSRMKKDGKEPELIRRW
jgi:hypothetical protein